MLIANSLLLFTTLISLFLGLFIFIGNSRRLVNRTLTLFIVGVFIWLLTNLLTNISGGQEEVLFFARATFIGPVLLAYFFLLFTKAYTDPARLTRRQFVLWGLAPAGLLTTTFTRLNIESIKPYGQNTVAGPSYIALVLLLVVYFGWGFVTLLHQYRRSADRVQKAQIRYMFVGIALALIPGLAANAILPLLGYSNAVFYGPNGIVLLAIMMSLAIVRHRLLDLRLIVARSLAYLLSLTTLTAVFFVTAVFLGNLLFGPRPLDRMLVRAFYAGLAVMLALVFPRLKLFFDKTTNRIFFRDAYDTQAFLDAFNKVLVATYELTPLLRKSAKIIEENLKPTYTLFGIKETETTQSRAVGTAGHPTFSEEGVAFVRSITPHMHRKVIVVDLLEEKYADLQKVLQNGNIAILARLASSNDEEGIGYLVLGPKKSGNMYSSQDVKVIEIIANELVIAIQNALRFEEIENFNLTLQAKVEDATRKLRRTNEKLKQLDETKDDFISMASHQLRTPLTSVKGYLSMVLEGDAGAINKTQHELLEQAFFSSQRMVFLIADLLNVSRLKTGKFVIEPTPVNLAEMVEQEMQQLHETAAARQLTFTYDKPERFPTVMLDETKTRQVIMNFADNAIYYTPAGGHIRVELAETPHSVELRVVDDGIGVPRHEIPHLFTKFYRARNAQKARPDGTGLGLFMAKKVIVAQGGAVICESEEGKGSTFGFSFPKVPLAQAAPAQPDASLAKV